MSLVEQFRTLKRGESGEIPFSKIADDLRQGYIISWLNRDIPARREIYRVLTKFEGTYFCITCTNISFALESFHDPGESLQISTAKVPEQKDSDAFWLFTSGSENQGDILFWSKDHIPEESEFWRQFKGSKADLNATTKAFQRELAKRNPGKDPYEVTVRWFNETSGHLPEITAK